MPGAVVVGKVLIFFITRCANGMMVETTAFEGVFDGRGE